MKAFDYISPSTIEEALDILAKHGSDAKVMSGGTDLLVQMREDQINPRVIVDLKRIQSIASVRYTQGSGLSIGSLVTIREIELCPEVREHFSILTQAASVLGSVQIRNKGTIGGNLCNASPGADLAPPLLALNAAVRVRGRYGEKWKPLDEFFLDPGRTILEDDEILTEIHVPPPTANTYGMYLKFSSRKAMDLAVVGVATIVTLDDSGTRCTDVRIALGAVAPTPIRAARSEKLLRGNRIEREVIEKVSKWAADDSKPISDVRGSAWQRKEIVGILVSRSLKKAVEKIRESKTSR